MKRQGKVAKVALATVMATSIFGGMISSPYHKVEAAVTHENELVEMDRSNLISDGTFEAGGSAWNKRNNGVIASGISYNGGTKSGTVPKNSKSNDGHVSGYIGQSIVVEPNTDYIIKAYAKTDVAGSRGMIATKREDQSPVIKEVAVTSTDWQEYVLEINSGDNTEMLIQLVKWAGKTDADFELCNEANVYIDNVTVVKKEDMQDDGPYEIIWADDFNGTELNSDNWGYELGSIRGVEQQHYVKSEKNTFMRDGSLVLKATDRAVEDQYQNPRGSRKVIYDSGSIRTHGKQEFLYGRIEMKAKLPKGQGVFPAFWTLGSNFTLDGDISNKQGNPWSRCGEIDIMELTGKELGNIGNKQAWGTPHFYAPKSVPETDGDNDNRGSGGKAYTISEDFNNEYHIFGVNWSPDKIEWYVDGVIYNTLDFSNPVWGKYAKMSYSQPQYIQFNLAMGGDWPGDAGTDLAGTEFDIDYVYYAQNQAQKAAAKEYYDAAPVITGAKDITMAQGDIPNLLANITSDKDTFVDFSIDNEYMFKNEGGLTNAEKVCSGKDDAAKLATLPVGKYNIHYTALPNDIEYEESNVPNREKEYKMTRKTVVLTVQEREFPTNVTLSGKVGDKLSTVILPTGWSWDTPDAILVDSTTEYTVNYANNGFTTTATVTVNVIAEEEPKPEEPKPEEPKPEVPSDKELPTEIIEEIVNEVNQASAGDRVVVDMNEATIVPKDILISAKGKDVIVVLNMDQYTWTINGLDITSNDLENINLAVTMDTATIPTELIGKIAGNNPVQQISLAHNGNFGFTATLTLNVGSQYKGKDAKLYYYDGNDISYMNTNAIDAQGNVLLSFKHASDYAIVISEKEVNDSNPDITIPDKKPQSGTGDKDKVNTSDNTLLEISGVLAVISLISIVMILKRNKRVN